MTYELVAADTLNPEQIHDLRTMYEGGYAVADRAPWSRVCTNRLPADHGVALMRGDVAIGFALLRLPSGADYAVLRYFVIDPAHRGHGVGARFWQLIGAYAKERGCRLLVWDVAAPEQPADDTGDHTNADGHAGIYERAGGSLVPVGAYDETNASDRRPQTTAMRLVATVLDDAADTLDARALRRIAMDVCAQRYESGIEGPDDRPSIDSAHEP